MAPPKSHASPTVAPVPLPIEGISTFSNPVFWSLIVLVPKVLTWFIPYLSVRWFGFGHFFLLAFTGIPTAIAYWWAMSRFGSRVNEKLQPPGRPIEHYLDIKDPELRAKYHGQNKIPIQIAHDAYFAGKIDLKGDVLEVLEYRHDWATFHMTIELFKYVFFNLIPDVIFHTGSQDETQIQDNYDRGNDFYEWFLGPRMIYTSGIVFDQNRVESLEELQDNKLSIVGRRLDLQPEDKLLDIGCGWGTLVAHMGKNYGCDVTGVTLAKEQAHFGTKRLRDNGVPENKGRILNCDFRDVKPEPKGKFSKIVSLEMAEHVGIRRYRAFLRQVYDLLDDDGIFVFQVSGIRPQWQYEDLIWGLFMNKYVFPGADASLSVGWVITQLEAVGFEVKSCDVFGEHYSATLWRWYQNWLGNKEKVLAKYGERWYRVWAFFLAWSVIASRQGSAAVYQITLHKNLNAFPRIDGTKSHLAFKPNAEKREESVI